MQQACSSYTVDPTFLNLKAHPTAPPHNSETSLAVDDIAIASGQADYDYSGKDFLNPWSNPYHDGRRADEFGLEGVSFDSTHATEARSAPARVWSMRGGANSDSSSQCAGSPPVGEVEAWNHLQTFASGASSAPGLDYADSHIIQNGAPSQSPSNPLLPGSSFGSSRESHNYYQASPLEQRMLCDSRFAHDPRINSFCGDVQDTPHHYSATPQPSCLGQDYNVREEIDWAEAEVSPSTGIRPLLQDDHSMLNDLTSSTIEPRPIPRRRSDRIPGLEDMGHGSEYMSQCLDESLGWGLTGESWQKLQPEDRNFLTATEGSWQQQQDLDSGAGGIFSSASAGYQPSGPEYSMRNNHLIPHHIYRAAYRRGTHDATSESSPDCPGAIMIPGSSIRYDADLASSFPPTAGHFPDYVPTVRRAEHLHSPLSSSQPIIKSSKPVGLPMRRKTSKTQPTRRSRSGSLKVIQEHDHSLASSPTGSLRGRRKGPLDPATALAAGQKRSEGTCEGNLPCEGCQKNSNAKSWGQPCHKANFMDMIEAGTCNAVFQCSASVRPIEGNQRRCLQYSGGFNLDTMIDSLRARESHYNIRVRQFSGLSYTLDLAKLTKLISTVQIANKLGSCELDDFGRHKTSKASDWLDCVTEFDQSASVIERTIICNNMPSRNGYFYQPLNRTSSRPMDVDNEKDERDIRLAVHLCRIVLRALEVNAFRALQKEVNNLPKNRSTNTDIESLAQNLIKILFNLRWRIAWWALVGVSSNIQDDSRGRYTERVSMLTQTLYFWYFVVRKRLPPLGASALKGIRNRYADAAQAVLDDFPDDESIDGFHAWMARGHGLIHRAYVLYSVPQPFSSS